MDPDSAWLKHPGTRKVNMPFSSMSENFRVQYEWLPNVYVHYLQMHSKALQVGFK